jgi:hypothetical protein
MMMMMIIIIIITIIIIKVTPVTRPYGVNTVNIKACNRTRSSASATQFLSL